MTRRVITERWAALVTLAAAITLAAGGCGEKEVPYIVDADEIIRYVNEVGIARELFRATDLVNPDPYTVPFDSAVFHDRVISRTRGTEVYLVPLKIPDTSPGASRSDSVPNDPDKIYVDHGYLGRVREGLIRVFDQYRIEITRAYSADTLLDTTTVELSRYGFFLKLGADNRAYVGWSLWGFNGLGDFTPPVVVRGEASGGAEFIGNVVLYPETPKSDFRYIPTVNYVRLTAMDTIRAGETIHLTSTKSGGILATTQLVSDIGPDGPFTRRMVRYDMVDYVDSLSYRTTSSGTLFYNLIFIQTLTERTYPIRNAFVIPYRH